MTAADKHLDTGLPTRLVAAVIGDGAIGTQLRTSRSTTSRGLGLQRRSSTALACWKPFTRNYFEAGADAVETDTFGCNLSTSALTSRRQDRDLSQKGTAIAHRVTNELGDLTASATCCGDGPELPTWATPNAR